jgi:cation:H+ antiporter
MFNGLGLPILLAIFAACAGVIWIAGVKLADTTDILSSRLHLGKALGGIIVLAVATNLPEVAITVSAALAGNLGVAVGNILGGIAIQTVVLVAMDIAMKEKMPLTYRAASLTLVVEAVLVVAVLIVSIMATQLPSTLIAARLTPGVVMIAVLWVIGVWLSSKASKGLPWHDTSGTAPDGQEEPKGHSQTKKDDASGQQGESTARIALVFGTAAHCSAHWAQRSSIRRNGACSRHIAARAINRDYLGTHERLSARGQRHLRRKRLSSSALPSRCRHFRQGGFT